MGRLNRAVRVAWRRSPGVNGLGSVRLAKVFAGLLLLFASASAEAAWVVPFQQPPIARSTAPDQTWLTDVPEKPGARPKPKVAVFVFKGDDVYEPVRAAMVRTLRAKGLNVTTTILPVDSVAQYREMGFALNLGVFVEGEMTGEGARQRAVIRLRSGVTGQPIGSAKFSGATPAIVGAVSRTVWSRVGSTIMRACSSASRPRPRPREPLRIEAGAPLEEATHGT